MSLQIVPLLFPNGSDRSVLMAKNQTEEDGVVTRAALLQGVGDRLKRDV